MKYDLNDLLKKTSTIINDVVAFIRKESAGFDRNKIEYKGVNDLVSYVDKGAEEQLVAGLKELVPEAGFITEEGTIEKSERQLTWIVDPLDGTTNFAHGLPAFAVSVALTDGDKTVLGVVHEVNRDECFYAINGNAFCNGEAIQVSNQEQLSGSLLATGLPYNAFNKMEPYLNILSSFMKNTHGIRRIGSAAVDLAYVACGRFEGFFEYNLNAWDVAAGAYIVQCAGGTVSDFKGGRDFLYGREIIAANAVHGAVLATVRKYWEDQNSYPMD